MLEEKNYDRFNRQIENLLTYIVNKEAHEARKQLLKEKQNEQAKRV